MIKSTNEILTQNVVQMEVVLRNLMENILKQEANEKLDIDVAEKLIGEAIQRTVKIILSMVGVLLSNISQRDDCKCDQCKKQLTINKKNVKLSIMTMFGVIEVIRDTIFCRICVTAQAFPTPIRCAKVIAYLVGVEL